MIEKTSIMKELAYPIPVARKFLRDCRVPEHVRRLAARYSEREGIRLKGILAYRGKLPK